MGLGDASKSRVTFLNIYGESVVRQWSSKPSEEEIPSGKTLQTRKNSNDKEVFYVEWDYVEGWIKNIEIKSGNYGDQILITLDSIGDSFVLTFGLESSYGMSFMKKSGNIELDKEVGFYPWKMTGARWSEFTKINTDAEFIHGLAIRHKGEKNLKDSYTEENGLPKTKVTKRGNKTKYDKSDKVDFLYKN